MTAIAASAASLTGLLFVALSVAPRTGPSRRPSLIQQVRAAAALLAFLNALAVSLFGLVPGTNVGYPAAILGLSGVVLQRGGDAVLPGQPADEPGSAAGRPG